MATKSKSKEAKGKEQKGHEEETNNEWLPPVPHMALADLDHHFKRPMWPVAEAIWLLFELEPPYAMNCAPFEAYHGKTIVRVHQLANECARNDQIPGIFWEGGTLSGTHVGPPKSWIKWAIGMGFDISPELKELSKINQKRATQSYRPLTETILKEVITSLGKTLFNIFPKLNYEQFQRFPPVEEAIARYEEDISTDTLRDWLNEAGIKALRGAPSQEFKEQLRLALPKDWFENIFPA